jgi:hypothetical protein
MVATFDGACNPPRNATPVSSRALVGLAAPIQQETIRGRTQASGVEPGWNSAITVDAVASVANSSARQAMKAESS